jgi:hypothetical protein
MWITHLENDHIFKTKTSKSYAIVLILKWSRQCLSSYQRWNKSGATLGKFYHHGKSNEPHLWTFRCPCVPAKGGISTWRGHTSLHISRVPNQGTTHFQFIFMHFEDPLADENDDWHRVDIGISASKALHNIQPSCLQFEIQTQTHYILWQSECNDFEWWLSHLRESTEIGKIAGTITIDQTDSQVSTVPQNQQSDGMREQSREIRCSYQNKCDAEDSATRVDVSMNSLFAVVDCEKAMKIALFNVDRAIHYLVDQFPHHWCLIIVVSKRHLFQSICECLFWIECHLANLIDGGFWSLLQIAKKVIPHFLICPEKEYEESMGDVISQLDDSLCFILFWTSEVNWQILCAVGRFSIWERTQGIGGMWSFSKWTQSSVKLVLQSRTISLKWLSIFCRLWHLGVKSVRTGPRFWSSIQETQCNWWQSEWTEFQELLTHLGQFNVIGKIIAINCISRMLLIESFVTSNEWVCPSCSW